MTTSELIQQAKSKASEVMKVSVVTFNHNYQVELDSEYMELSVYHMGKGDGEYQVLKIKTNSRTDSDVFGLDLLLQRLDAKLSAMKAELN